MKKKKIRSIFPYTSTKMKINWMWEIDGDESMQVKSFVNINRYANLRIQIKLLNSSDLWRHHQILIDIQKLDKMHSNVRLKFGGAFVSNIE